jgi:phospholipid-translocating ATPase
MSDPQLPALTPLRVPAARPGIFVSATRAMLRVFRGRARRPGGAWNGLADEDEAVAVPATRMISVSDECAGDGRVDRAGRWVRLRSGKWDGDNAVCNQKYSTLTFLPLVLYEQFRMFYNLFFLFVACSQFIPALRVGFFWTYFGPLVFVLLVSLTKEASDDIARFRRDKNMNLFAYTLLVRSTDTDIISTDGATGIEESGRAGILRGRRATRVENLIDWATPGTEAVRIASQDIRVGDVLVLETDERVPADCVLLRASAFGPNGTGNSAVTAPDDASMSSVQAEDSGSIFIRTDQLDGETDWKLRRAVAATQSLPSEGTLLHSRVSLQVEAPKKEIYDFVGVLEIPDPISATHSAGAFAFAGGSTPVVMGGGRGSSLSGAACSMIREPLNLENTLWANTVVASGRAVCVVVYNGRETRSVLNASSPRSKIGSLDLEINRISKMLFALLISLSAVLTALRGFGGQWLMYFFRYFLLLSSIIPISMRVNLDMAKIAFSTFMENDSLRMPGCTVRNSNLPEELGRVEYLLTDKTGTLTQNDMVFKKLHLGSMLFARESLDDIRGYLRLAFVAGASSSSSRQSTAVTPIGSKESSSVSNSHNDDGTTVGQQVISVLSSEAPEMPSLTGRRRLVGEVCDALLAIGLAHNVTPVDDAGQRTYQAASPDEVALVKFAESVGIILAERSMTCIVLSVPGGRKLRYEILSEFPFTSESKRMGIIVQSHETSTISLIVKGADSVISKRVKYNDWLDEECGNLAREGLRTLVYAKRDVSADEYGLFAERWMTARMSQINRKETMDAVQSDMERDMQLLALTGVEDKLQYNVRESLEKLRHAGVRVWMLTGDKVETATCIAVSSRLAERSHGIFTITGITSRNEAARALSRFRRQATTDVLVVDGTSLQIYLDMFPAEFVDAASIAPAAVMCRCSPTQKSEVVALLQEYLGKRVAAIGDGGNDVSMIQQANVGIGIPGKEGMQASLASDFSITSFSHMTRLMLWHGRNSYKRSARMAQFVMHRGLIISVIQTVYCALFFYAAVSVYSGWILVGYATVFTMFPVFSLILDEDVSEQATDTYPELYKDLQKGRALSLKTFLIWVFKSIYQGTMVMVFSVYVLWDDEYFTTLHLSAISFTALILTELVMVGAEVHSWHWGMVAAQVCSLCFYAAAVVVLQDTFDHALMMSWGFAARVVVVTAVSCLPVTIGKWLQSRIAPAPYSKLQAE